MVKETEEMALLRRSEAMGYGWADVKAQALEVQEQYYALYGEPDLQIRLTTNGAYYLGWGNGEKIMVKGSGYWTDPLSLLSAKGFLSYSEWIEWSSTYAAKQKVIH